MGVSSEVRCGIHSSIHADLTDCTSAAMPLPSRPLPPRPRISSMRPRRTSLASPTTAWLMAYSLSRSLGSSVDWMRTLPRGTVKLARVFWKLVPMPKTVSDLPRKWPTILVAEVPPAPSDRGWSSGKQLLPRVVVMTGALMSSASSRKLVHGLGVGRCPGRRR